MTKFLLGTTMLAGLLVAGAAQAADMPLKAPAQPVYSNWTGFYIGGHVGYGWSRTGVDDADLVGFFTGDSFASPKPRGVVGGFHGGFNWQAAQTIVLGIEGDFSFSDMNQNQTLFVPGGPLVFSPFIPPITGGPCVNCDLTDHLSVKIDNLASVRARLGFLVTPSFMLYATGGGAWAEAKVDVSGSAVFTNAAQPPSLRGTTFASLSASGDKTFSGWVIGGGGEYMLTQNILFRLEYLHYDFGSTTVAVDGTINRVAIAAGFIGGPSPAFSGALSADVKASLRTDVVRAGLSYKF